MITYSEKTFKKYVVLRIDGFGIIGLAYRCVLLSQVCFINGE